MSDQHSAVFGIAAFLARLNGKEPPAALEGYCVSRPSTRLREFGTHRTVSSKAGPNCRVDIYWSRLTLR